MIGEHGFSGGSKEDRVTAKDSYRKTFLAPGAFKRIVIIGAGESTYAAVKFAAEWNLECFVFMGPRQHDCKLFDGSLFRERVQELGIELIVTDSLQSCDKPPTSIAPSGSIAFSLLSPFIIKKDLIDHFDGRVFNSHSSALPEWRGAGGFSWRILVGERRSAVTFHLVTPGVDDGDIVWQRSYDFPESLRYPIDYFRYSKAKDCEDLRGFLDRIHEGRSFSIRKQDPQIATYFPRLHTPTNGFINWSWHGKEIEKFILAFSYPYEGATTFINRSQARIMDCAFEENRSLNHPFMAGLIVNETAERYIVLCDGGRLRINKEHITCGARIRVGDRLNTPSGTLDAARGRRVLITPIGVKLK